MSVRTRRAVDALPEYKVARNAEAVKKEYGLSSLIKLAANENTLGFSPAVFEALKALTSRYPDGAAAALRKRLSERLNVPSDHIVFGSGSFELIQLACLAFLEGGEETLGAEPSFGWYKTATAIMGGVFRGIPVTSNYSVDLDALSRAVTERTKIIWLCNPNNPTGTIFTGEQLEAFLAKIPDSVLVVLDEAYVDFVEQPGYPQSLLLYQKYENLVVFRTFSKLEGLASLRVGYAIGSAPIIAALNKVRIQSNVNQAAQLAALASLDDEEFKARTIQNARTEKQKFYRAFTRLGFSYVPSNTNFIFFDIKREAAPIVEEFIRHGILIRGGNEYGFPTHIRISIGTPEENDAAIAVFNKLFLPIEKQSQNR